MPAEHRYSVYGLGVRSDLPLALPLDRAAGPAHVDIRTAHPGFFRDLVPDVRFDPQSPAWYRYGRLADGSSYLAWDRLGEFLISNGGGTITCRRFDDASVESFQVYLLQRALSFALVQQGYEPLHSTAVVIDGCAIAFLGSNGFGKSSLAAAFLSAGDKLLTDDLLLVSRGPSGSHAHPGPARIKLFPRTARRMLGSRADGVAMNLDTKKLVMPHDPAQVSDRPAPLKAFYVLPRPHGTSSREIRFEPLQPRPAFLEIIQHTFNVLPTDADRLRRQFTAAAKLIEHVPVKQMRYTRTLESLGAVRRALVADLAAN